MQLQSGSTALNVSIETITPEKAHAYLASSNGKQTKGRSGVKRYAEDMRKDRWQMTGEPVIFNSNGKLDNGYTRMEACILSETPFTTLVVRGIEPRAFDTIDTGNPRRLSDLLRFRGKSYVNIVEYSAKRLAALDKGLAVDSRALVTRQEEMAAVKRYPVIEEYAAQTQALGKGLPHSLLAFVWYLFGSEYPNKMRDFFRAFAPLDGDTLNTKHVAYQLRLKLTGTETLCKMERIQYCFSAINQFLRGEITSKAWLKIDATSNEVFIGTSGKSIDIA